MQKFNIAIDLDRLNQAIDTFAKVLMVVIALGFIYHAYRYLTYEPPKPTAKEKVVGALIEGNYTVVNENDSNSVS